MQSEYLLRSPRAAHRLGRIVTARVVAPATVTRWLASGWQAARIQPLMWLSLALVSADCTTLALYAPSLWLFCALIAPAFVGTATYLETCSAQGQPADARSLYRMLARRHAALLAIGVYSLAIATVSRAALTGLWHALVPGSAASPQLHLLAASLATLPFVLAGALAWQAPALIMLRGMTPSRAMLASIHAASLNWRLTLAALVAGMGIAALATQLPAGGAIGALLAAPLLSGLLLMAARSAYLDIFGPY